MTTCAAASIAHLLIAAGPSTRRPMAAVIGVVLGRYFHPGLLVLAARWWLPLPLLALAYSPGGWPR